MKLSTKDLMVDDWVYNKHHKKNIQITPYDYFVHGHKDDCTQYLLGTHPAITIGRDLEPIPLTPEILEKNGFYWGYPVDVEDMASNVFGGIGIEMPPKSWVWDDGDGVISIIFPNENDGGIFTCYLDKHLTLMFDDEIFVHQLQHALKLVNIDKKITL